MPYVHDCVPVYSLKRGRMQPCFDHVKRLIREEPPLLRDDPDQLPFRLQSQNLVGIQQKVLAPDAADQSLGWRQGVRRIICRFDLRQLPRDLPWLANEALRCSIALRKRSLFKGFNR